ncbi:hypothetical protein CALVIDRAFT_479728 [Calocera viscosa TUFC12733]|uniref:Uncharacterized protein n=1 Tax=Calocera viscosa (strain TUFC12733) TaxID=1330018 RepID=A0A167NAG3_CALVF|nr:hypothetical protein CALVIDRAFT_479728 [Calocera viscosa TUFC12733]
MGFLDSYGDNSQQKQAYDQVVNAPHKAALSHELLAAAASYEAAKAYEDHEAKNGKPANHQVAKELIASFAGAFIDHIVETKGLDFVDKEEAKYKGASHPRLVLTCMY